MQRLLKNPTNLTLALSVWTTIVLTTFHFFGEGGSFIGLDLSILCCGVGFWVLSRYAFAGESSEETDEHTREITEKQLTLEETRAKVSKQSEQLKFLKTHDSLTQCFNRRSFLDAFDKSWNGSIRYEQDLSCIMVSVDDFKSVNEVFGSEAGDEVLRQVAAVFLESARDADIVCRYSAKQFCVILPNVDLSGAELACERHVQTIADLEFDGFTVTASFGCSDRLQDCVSKQKLLNQAEQALHHAQRNGKSQVWRFDAITEEADRIEPGINAAQKRLSHAEALLDRLDEDLPPAEFPELGSHLQ